MLKHKNQNIVRVFKARDKTQANSSLWYVLWTWSIVGKHCEHLFPTLDNWSGNHIKFLFIQWSSMWMYITDNISGVGSSRLTKAHISMRRWRQGNHGRTMTMRKQAVVGKIIYDLCCSMSQLKTLKRTKIISLLSSLTKLHMMTNKSTKSTCVLHQVSPSVCFYKITYLFSFFFWSFNISRISSPSFIEIIKKTHHTEYDSDFKNCICYM